MILFRFRYFVILFRFRYFVILLRFRYFVILETIMYHSSGSDDPTTESRDGVRNRAFLNCLLSYYDASTSYK